MLPKNKSIVRWLTPLVILFTVCVHAQTPNNDRRFLDDTRRSYSLLHRQGLEGLKASVIPSWNVILKDLGAKEKTSALRLANRLRFVMEADAKGGMHVTHQIVGPRPDKPTLNALDNIAKGVDLSITSFLMSWAPFMLTYLIPEDLDHFVLQDLEWQRLLTFKQGEVEVSVAITKDFEIKELRTAQGAIKPLLTKNKDGFVLIGYEGNNEDPVVGSVKIKAKIDSIPTQGMLLPRTVVLNGLAGTTPINFEMRITNYILKKRV